MSANKVGPFCDTSSPWGLPEPQQSYCCFCVSSLWLYAKSETQRQKQRGRQEQLDTDTPWLSKTFSKPRRAHDVQPQLHTVLRPAFVARLSQGQPKQAEGFLVIVVLGVASTRSGRTSTSPWCHRGGGSVEASVPVNNEVGACYACAYSYSCGLHIVSGMGD